MTKLKYESHARGGRGSSFQQLSLGDPQRQLDQQIIAFLKESQGETASVRDEYLRSLRNKHGSESKNFEILEGLRAQKLDNERRATEKRRDTEVKYYEDLADEYGKEASHWENLTPTLAKNLGKLAQGVTKAGIYLRDEKLYQEMQKEWDEKDAPHPDDLASKAHDTITKEAQAERKLQQELGNYTGSEKIYNDVYETSSKKKFIGIIHGRRATATIHEEFGAIIANAQSGSEHLEFQRWLEGKGVRLNSVAGREAREIFDKKLKAVKTTNYQNRLVQNSTQQREEIKSNLLESFKSGKQDQINLHLNELVLHDAGAHTIVNGKYSSPEMRVNPKTGKPDYGAVSDTILEELMGDKAWSSWEEYYEAVLTNITLPTFTKKASIPGMPYHKQRAHTLKSLKDKFTSKRDAGVEERAKNEKLAIQGRITVLNNRIELGRKVRENKNFKPPEGSRPIDRHSKEGISELVTLQKTAKSKAEKDAIGTMLWYDPSSRVSSIIHTEMLEELARGNEKEYLFLLHELEPHQQKYYTDLPMVKSLTRMASAGLTYKKLKDQNIDYIKEELGAAGYSQTQTFSTIEAAADALTQLQYSANAGFKEGEYEKGALVSKLREVADEALDFKNGLFRIDTIGDSKEFVHFSRKAKEQILINADINGKVSDFNTELIPNPSLSVNKQLTREQIKKIDLISDGVKATIIQDSMQGVEIRLPKILWEYAKFNPKVSLVDIVNDQLENEGLIGGPHGLEEFTEKSILKATTEDFYKIKTGLTTTFKPRDMSAACAWADVNKCTMELHGQPFVDPKVNTYSKKMQSPEGTVSDEPPVGVDGKPLDFKTAFSKWQNDGDLEKIYNSIYSLAGN